MNTRGLWSLLTLATVATIVAAPAAAQENANSNANPDAAAAQPAEQSGDQPQTPPAAQDQQPQPDNQPGSTPSTRRSGKIIRPRVGSTKPDDAASRGVNKPDRAKKDSAKTEDTAAIQPAGAKGSSFELNPNAKWACDQTTVVHEPAWRGEGSLDFTFLIRNEGTENLQINAKGG